jgi:hypothetical protein
VANHLPGPHEIMQFPVSHSELREEQHWDRFEAAWLRLAIEGVPSDFADGGQRRVHEVGGARPGTVKV